MYTLQEEATGRDGMLTTVICGGVKSSAAKALSWPATSGAPLSNTHCIGLNNYKHHFEVELRCMTLWLYGTMMLVILLRTLKEAAAP